MRLLFSIITLTLCAFTADAQTFLGNLQQNEQGKGHVTVSQSADIDALVNGAAKQKKQTTTTQQPVKQTQQQNTAKPQQQGGTKSQQTDSKHDTAKEPVHTQIVAPTQTKQQDVTPKNNNKENTQKHDNDVAPRETTSVASPEKEVSGKQARVTKPVEANDVPSTTVDTRKKMMSHSYKTTGYRIQVFSGGNSRKDRQAAENAGTKMKSYFPTEPVYVHFYSPSWKCRMGNYTSVGEARKVLAQVKRLGYRQAVIVKGPISVQY